MNWKIFGTSIIVVAMSACGSKSKDSNDDKSGNQDQVALSGTCNKSEVTGIVQASEVVASKNSKYCIKLEWIKGPVVDDYSEAKITFTTPALGEPKTVEAVKVTPWMKLHGHGTGDVQPELKPLGGKTNVFGVTNIYFIMSGPWELNIEATIDGVADSLEYSVKVPE